MKTQTPAVALSHRVAIKTKYLPVTNHRGSRIKVGRMDARKGETLTVDWDYSLDTPDNHARAVEQYLAHMEWDGTYIIGAGVDGYVAVWTGE
jgi:hypothetical protein